MNVNVLPFLELRKEFLNLFNIRYFKRKTGKDVSQLFSTLPLLGKV